uniref:Putative bidirectional sugar transporter SWEET2 n=1 Tax=Davidia involucrata TaxID=16924 RepID=A0A5B6Z1F8_DAVIN
MPRKRKRLLIYVYLHLLLKGLLENHSCCRSFLFLASGFCWQLRILALLLAVFGLFAAIAVGSLNLSDRDIRHMFIGFLSGASLISMFASPLFIINLVIRTRSVEFMPFCLSLSTFLMSTSFFLYGYFNLDPFVYVPNGIGTILGIVQLVLYSHYKNTSREDCREPLIVSYA